MTGYYCADFCKYNRQVRGGRQKVRFIGLCKVTKKEVVVTVFEEDLEKLYAGELIQNAFPYLKAWEREFFLNGYSEEGWKQLFGEEP